MRALTVAAAQYPIDWLESFSAFEKKLARWVEDGVRQGAELLVFPEYAGSSSPRFPDARRRAIFPARSRR